MRVEEIALRSEIRQMLNEAGFNKNTLKDLVKEVLTDELKRAINQALNETDYNTYIKNNIDTIINKATRAEVRDRITDKVIGNYFNRMQVDVKIDPIMSYKNCEEYKNETN